MNHARMKDLDFQFDVQADPTLFDKIIKPAVNIPLANKIENYYSNILPGLNKKQSIVLNAIYEIGKPCTMHQVAEFLHVELYTISGRFGELVKKNRLIVKGKSFKNRSVYEVIK